MIGNDMLLVSVDFNNEDAGVLIVGRKKKDQAVEIVNVFADADAHALYERLVTAQKRRRSNENSGNSNDGE